MSMGVLGQTRCRLRLDYPYMHQSHMYEYEHDDRHKHTPDAHAQASEHQHGTRSALCSRQPSRRQHPMKRHRGVVRRLRERHGERGGRTRPRRWRRQRHRHAVVQPFAASTARCGGKEDAAKLLQPEKMQRIQPGQGFEAPPVQKSKMGGGGLAVGWGARRG